MRIEIVVMVIVGLSKVGSGVTIHDRTSNRL